MRGRGPTWGALRIPAAVGLLRRERSLWALCALPFALNLALFATGLVVFLAYGWEPASAQIEAWLAVSDPTAWYQWLWVAPLRALAWLIRGLLLLALLFAVYFLFTVVGAVVAAPFLELLSQRVERLQTGALHTTGSGAVRSAFRVMAAEGKRTLFFVAVWLVILAVGFVPGLQLVAGAAGVLFAALFLPLDYTGHLLDRREIPFRSRRRWLWRHKRPMVGFGAAALATFLIPGLNFLALPVLVTAGTLLALELGTPEEVSDRSRA